MTHGQFAAQVRRMKVEHPERYCLKPSCLWNVSGGPCPKLGHHKYIKAEPVCAGK